MNENLIKRGFLSGFEWFEVILETERLSTKVEFSIAITLRPKLRKSEHGDNCCTRMVFRAHAVLACSFLSAGKWGNFWDTFFDIYIQNGFVWRDKRF